MGCPICLLSLNSVSDTHFAASLETELRVLASSHRRIASNYDAKQSPASRSFLNDKVFDYRDFLEVIICLLLLSDDRCDSMFFVGESLHELSGSHLRTDV